MKRSRFITIPLGVVALGLLAFAIFCSREPRHQGRTLTQWIEDGKEVYSRLLLRHPKIETSNDPRLPDFILKLVANDPEWQAASHALQQMAPEANRWLLKWLKSDDSSVRQKVILWLSTHPALHCRPRTSRHYNETAAWGFYLLGNAAKPAYPALVQLTSSPDPQRRLGALRLLERTGADKEILLPVLRRMIHDTNVDVIVATDFIFKFPKEGDAAGVYEMFPFLKGLAEMYSTNNQPYAN